MGDSKGAEGAARAAAQLMTPATPVDDKLFAGALLAEAQKDLTAAEEKYRQLATLDPDDAAEQLELADFLKRQTHNAQAVEAYVRALKLDPGAGRVYVDLCQLYSLLNDYPRSEQHAQSALKHFRDVGDRGGEAQALLCYGDALLRQGTRLKEARGHIEAAREILVILNYSYGLSRVYQYLGLVAGREHNYPAATQAFEEALSRSGQVGNKPIEGLALMNLGVAHDWMGHPEDAARYFERSRDVYQEIGDERRAAEQEYNAAAIRVNSDPNGAYRRLANARATFHTLGNVDFEVSAMKAQAESLAATRRFDEALRLLREAASIATERGLKGRLAAVKVSIGNVQLLQRDYDAARRTLEEVVATPEAPVEAEIALGRAYVRLGDKSSARKHLENGLARGQKSGEAKLVALAEESLRELSNEQRKR
jgi:tetratricopeptide (TPR) repeat protein